MAGGAAWVYADGGAVHSGCTWIMGPSQRPVHEVPVQPILWCPHVEAVRERHHCGIT